MASSSSAIFCCLLATISLYRTIDVVPRIAVSLAPPPPPQALDRLPIHLEAYTDPWPCAECALREPGSDTDIRAACSVDSGGGSRLPRPPRPYARDPQART